MGLNFGNTKQLFDHSKLQDTGINGSDRQGTMESTSSSSQTLTTITSSTPLVDLNSMSVNHASRTGRVFVIFSIRVGAAAADAANFQLQKDGSDVTAGARAVWITGNNEDKEVTIFVVDNNAESNTWKIQWGNDSGSTQLKGRDRTILTIDI